MSSHRPRSHTSHPTVAVSPPPPPTPRAVRGLPSHPGSTVSDLYARGGGYLVPSPVDPELWAAVADGGTRYHARLDAWERPSYQWAGDAPDSVCTYSTPSSLVTMTRGARTERIFNYSNSELIAEYYTWSKVT